MRNIYIPWNKISIVDQKRRFVSYYLNFKRSFSSLLDFNVRFSKQKVINGGSYEGKRNK